MKSPPSRAFVAPHVHPRPRKRPPRCTLDCGFKTSESPALRGFVGGPRALATAALYLVLKSNGLRYSKNLPVKFGFSSKTVPANIVKKLPPQRCPKPLFIASFNFSHKWPTFAFTGESGYTLGFAQRIAHSGSHGETGGLPSSGHNAALCCQRNCSVIPLDSAVLLYTYISRFSVDPNYQQREKIRQSCRINFIHQPFLIPIFNFSHKCPRSLSQAKAGTPSAFGEKSHTAAHTPKQGAFRMGVVSLPPERFTRFGNPAWPGIRTAYFAALGSWPGGALEERRKPSGQRCAYACRCPEGVAAPLGCVIFLQFGDVAVFFHSVRSTF